MKPILSRFIVVVEKSSQLGNLGLKSKVCWSCHILIYQRDPRTPCVMNGHFFLNQSLYSLILSNRLAAITYDNAGLYVNIVLAVPRSHYSTDHAFTYCVRRVGRRCSNLRNGYVCCFKVKVGIRLLLKFHLRYSIKPNTTRENKTHQIKIR